MNELKTTKVTTVEGQSLPQPQTVVSFQDPQDLQGPFLEDLEDDERPF